jgi:PDDEXK-like domain of unknown function (DUF3799)
VISVTDFQRLSADDYHSDPCPVPSLSSSIAKILINQSPKHAWYAHPRLNPSYKPVEDSRFDIGSVAHMMLLEKRSDRITIVNADDWRTKAAKEAREEARANSRFPILARHHDRVSEMVVQAQAYIATTELAGILENSHSEVSIRWREGNAWCRSRLDLLSESFNVILDYKTTENAEPEAFIRQIGRMDYDLQAEFYVRGTHAQEFCQKEPVFIFLAQEISQPYSCSLVSLANSYRAVGQQKVEKALSLWKHCTAHNTWAAYSTRIAYAEPRPYEMEVLDEPVVTESEETES